MPIVNSASPDTAQVADLQRRVAELETFAREISHDLKAPLAGICGYAQLLAHMDLGGPRPAEYDEFVAGIEHATQRMSRLIDDVLAYATVGEERVHPATIDLSSLVDDLVADRPPATHGPAPRITRADLPLVRGDHGMVRRLLENLIGNAVKYVRPGEAAQVHVSAWTDGGFVGIEVTDRGVGIPDGQHEAVFGELHRAHADAYPGTGLGLTICRRIVQRMGGTIHADPHFRDGARIWFTLPAAT
jgi:signal transduction histidine kinase